jgi:hypothetical protein
MAVRPISVPHLTLPAGLWTGSHPFGLPQHTPPAGSSTAHHLSVLHPTPASLWTEIHPLGLLQQTPPTGLLTALHPLSVPHPTPPVGLWMGSHPLELPHLSPESQLTGTHLALDHHQTIKVLDTLDTDRDTPNTQRGWLGSQDIKIQFQQKKDPRSVDEEASRKRQNSSNPRASGGTRSEPGASRAMRHEPGASRAMRREPSASRGTRREHRASRVTRHEPGASEARALAKKSNCTITQWMFAIGWKRVSVMINSRFERELPLYPFWMSQPELGRVIKRILAQDSDIFVQMCAPEYDNIISSNFKVSRTNFAFSFNQLHSSGN